MGAFWARVHAQTATTTLTPTSTSTPTPTVTTTQTVTATPPETLMDSGISMPTVIGILAAIILITLSIALAL